MSEQFLSPEEILRLGTSSKRIDKLTLASYLISARTARAVQAVFELLKIDPQSEPGLQTKICQIIYDNMCIVPQEEISDYIESMKERIELNSVDGKYFTDDQAGNC